MLGLLFEDHRLEDIVIVMDDKDFYNGTFVMERLMSISTQEINKRREIMASMSYFMQWGITLSIYLIDITLYDKDGKDLTMLFHWRWVQQ